MIAAKDGNTVAVAQLECHEQCHRFDRVVSTVDIIAHEEVIRVWRISTNAEQFG